MIATMGNGRIPGCANLCDNGFYLLIGPYSSHIEIFISMIILLQTGKNIEQQPLRQNEVP